MCAAPLVIARSAPLSVIPSRTAVAAEAVKTSIGTNGWSVVNATSHPAFSRIPAAAYERSLSSCLKRPMSVGPTTHGTRFSAK
jgi:hypothetical protein